jgi:CopG family nickel-responsive transcriptional regulator
MPDENYVYRTGISIPIDLLEKFDEIINQRGYPSRSEGVRDAIRAYITDYTWMSEMKGERHGVILMVYNIITVSCSQSSMTSSMNSVQL